MKVMSFLRYLSFVWWYLRQPPWDKGIVPPEVVEYMGAHPPGRALDLGCGTGTASIALARAGWRVSGVDFVPLAVHKARRKARQAGLDVDFHLGDVTRLPPSLLADRFNLVLDIGCFHGLDQQRMKIYLENLEKMLAPGGDWLVYGFFRPDEDPIPAKDHGLQGGIGRRYKLAWRRDGVERQHQPSAWCCYQF